MYLIPLTSKVEALSEILDVQISEDRQKILMKLADGLLLLARLKFPNSHNGLPDGSNDGMVCAPLFVYATQPLLRPLELKVLIVF